MKAEKKSAHVCSRTTKVSTSAITGNGIEPGDLYLNLSAVDHMR